MFSGICKRCGNPVKSSGFCPNCMCYTDIGVAIEKEKVQKEVHLCGYCGEKFNLLSDLNQHIGEKHLFTCEMCGKRFRDRNTLENYEKLRHSYDCKECNMRFLTEKDLNSHYSAKHVPHSQGYKPSYFYKYDKYSSNLKTSNRNISKKSKLKSITSNVKINNYDYLSQNKPKFRSNQSTKRFISEDKKTNSVVCYEKITHGYVCKICGMKFKTEKERNVHILEKHCNF